MRLRILLKHPCNSVGCLWGISRAVVFILLFNTATVVEFAQIYLEQVSHELFT